MLVSKKSHWDKTNKENYSLKLCMSFVCLVPVRLLLTSTAVLYHVNGYLQRAYWTLQAFKGAGKKFIFQISFFKGLIQTKIEYSDSSHLLVGRGEGGGGGGGVEK